MELQLNTPILLALALGALHVLEPVHGRSIFHAILVGSTRSFWRVIRFGAAVTVSHIFTAMLLAGIALWIGHSIGVEQLSLAGKIIGIAITLIFGIVMLVKAIRHDRTERKQQMEDADCHCSCHEVAEEESPAKPDEGVKEKVEGFSATWLGITGGIIPCSASLATLVYALSSGQIVTGVKAILAFGIGLGGTLTIVGMITVATARTLSFTDSPAYRKITQYLPGLLLVAVSLLSIAMLFFVAD